MMMSPSAYRKTLQLRSIDGKIIVVDDEKVIRESDLMKFAIFQIGYSAASYEVPLNTIDANDVMPFINLAHCFRDDPPYSNNVKDFECMPSNHPAIQFTQQLSTNEFIAVSRAARCMRAPRLLDFLGSTSHKACTPTLINNVLKEGPFFTDVDHVRACG